MYICVYYAILYKRLEHLRVWVSSGGFLDKLPMHTKEWQFMSTPPSILKKVDWIPPISIGLDAACSHEDARKS